MRHAVTQPTLASKAARLAALAAIDKADELGVPMNISVVDASGLPLAFLRSNGAPLHSIRIAEDKAVTAASFGLASGAWDTEVGNTPRLWDSLVARPGFCALAGGFPIRIEGSVVGGIGVSGGTENQDVECARAGLAVLGTS